MPLPLLNETFEGPGSPLDFVISKNVTRRHLTESQRAMIAAKIANCSEGRPANTAQIQAVSQEEAARKLDVSRSSVQSATRVIERGIPELVKAVDGGQIKVSKGAAIAKKKEPTEQAALLAKALGPKPRSKHDTHRKPKNVGASTNAASGSASPEDGPSTPAEPCDPAGSADDGPGHEQSPDVKGDSPPAVAKSSSADAPPHAPPLEWPGVDDPAESALLDDLRGHLRAALGVIDRFCRTAEDGQKDAAVVRNLWTASRPFWETFVGLSKVISPRSLANCGKCKGSGAIARKQCPECAGLGKCIME